MKNYTGDLNIDMDPKVKRVLNALVEAHDAYCELGFSIANQQWAQSMNSLQAIIYTRHLQNLYPEEIKK